MVQQNDGLRRRLVEPAASGLAFSRAGSTLAWLHTGGKVHAHALDYYIHLAPHDRQPVSIDAPEMIKKSRAMDAAGEKRE